MIDDWNPDGRYVGTLPPDDPPMPDAFGPDGLAVLGRAGRTGRAEGCGGEVAMRDELIMR